MDPEVIGHANHKGVIRLPRLNPNPEVCTGGALCQIWMHVMVTRLGGGKVRLTHLTPEQLQAEASAADG